MLDQKSVEKAKLLRDSKHFKDMTRKEKSLVTEYEVELFKPRVERLKKTRSVPELLETISNWRRFYDIVSDKAAEALSDYAFLHICPHCGAELTGRINLEGGITDGRWVAECESCHQQFDVKVPKGRIFFAFTDPYDDEDCEDCYEPFKEGFTGKALTHVFSFKTIKAFMGFWSCLVEDGSIGPFGMWQWTIDTKSGSARTICSGAADPYDRDIYRDYFGNRFIMQYA